MKTKKAVRSSKKRSPINYARLATMWEQGKTYEQMGTALNMKGNEKADPYKPVRAAISNMLRGVASAWKDKSGRVCVLKPREGMRAIGVGKKMHRSPKNAKTTTTKKAVRKIVPKVDGKTLAAGGQ